MKLKHLDDIEDALKAGTPITLADVADINFRTCYPVVDKAGCRTEGGKIIALPTARVIDLVDAGDGLDGWHPVDMEGGPVGSEAAVNHKLGEFGYCTQCDYRG